MRAIALLLLLSPAFAAEADDWNLTEIFPSTDAWDAARDAVGPKVSALAACQGRLGKSSADLLGCLDQRFSVIQDLERLWVYASASADADNRVAAANARRGDVGVLWSRVGEASAFFEPELLAVGAKKLSKLMGKDPRFDPYRFYVDKTLAQAPHTLDARGEAMLAAAGPLAGAPMDVFQMLLEADMDWPTVTLSDGSTVTVDQEGYTVLRGSPNRADRQLGFDAFYEAIGGVQRTLGATLNGKLSAAVFEAKARGYAGTLEASLAPKGIPTDVYRTLVAQANAQLPTLHRYFRLRGRMLGIDQPTYVDIYPPMVAREEVWPLERAITTTIAATAPLGAAYTEVLERGLRGRWMDTYPKDGKSAGAYCTGVYGLHPYVLMNYQDDYESASTLAHEWGHAMHTWLASQAQPYPTADYETFMAEVASTFNEALLLDAVLKQAKDDEQRLFTLGSALETLRGTFFRQAMFAEFELAMHERAERGEALTGERFSEAYLELLRRYHGHDLGVLTVDEAYGAEWAWIPHFYFGYYVFQYSTSIAAASLLSQRVLSGQEGAVAEYLGLLEAGGSAHAYELLKDAGVDLATAAPYEALVARMNAIMDEMEALLAKR